MARLSKTPISRMAFGTMLNSLRKAREQAEKQNARVVSIEKMLNTVKPVTALRSSRFHTPLELVARELLDTPAKRKARAKAKARMRTKRKGTTKATKASTKARTKAIKILAKGDRATRKGKDMILGRVTIRT